MPDNQTVDAKAAVDAISNANRSQCAVGVQMQAYCNGVLEQPTVSFRGFTNLATYESQVNAGLSAAKDRANYFIDTITPTILTNAVEIGNYLDIHGAVPVALPAGSTKAEWLSALASVREEADAKAERASQVVRSLSTFHSGLTTDVAAFTRTVTELNAVVNGDNGVLDSLNQQIEELQGKIGGTIAGIVVSGLAVVGGGLMILVGGFAEAVTGGAATALVVGGVAVLAAGAGGALGAGLALAGLLDAKGDLVTRGSQLREEVQLALGMKTAFADLREHASVAVQSATAMQNAWEFLGGQLGEVASDLDKGIVGSDAIRGLWLTTANSAFKRAVTDTETIRQQMTGITVETAPEGTTIGDHVRAVAQRLAA